ncbi:MAG: associated Golgi protein [Verrucomicrobiales bacterium]|nr:associated Golgi protein [Verrucomicrobiales bacterium]
MSESGTAKPDNRTRVRLIYVALGLAMAGVFLFYFRKQINLKPFYNWIDGLSAPLLMVALIVLPAIGCPVTFVYPVVGGRFGPFIGMGMVAVATGLHLLFSFWIVKTVFRVRLEKWISKKNYKIPQIPPGEEKPVTLLVALIPGPPYTLKNLLMPMAGAPFKTYFFIFWPIHVIHAFLGLEAGHLGRDLSAGKIIFLITYVVVLSVLCGYVVRRIKARRKSAADEVSLQLKS